MSKEYELSLDGDAFNGLKLDFKTLLNKTLAMMQQKEVESASITMKIDITLEDGYAPDLEITAYPADRMIAVPTFKHKIKSSMKLEDEKSGVLGGDGFELVWNKEHTSHMLVAIKDGQTSMFEPQDDDMDEFMADDDEDEDGEEEDTEEEADDYDAAEVDADPS